MILSQVQAEAVANALAQLTNVGGTSLLCTFRVGSAVQLLASGVIEVTRTYQLSGLVETEAYTDYNAFCVAYDLQ